MLSLLMKKQDLMMTYCNS